MDDNRSMRPSVAPWERVIAAHPGYRIVYFALVVLIYTAIPMYGTVAGFRRHGIPVLWQDWARYPATTAPLLVFLGAVALRQHTGWHTLPGAALVAGLCLAVHLTAWRTFQGDLTPLVIALDLAFALMLAVAFPFSVRRLRHQAALVRSVR